MNEKELKEWDKELEEQRDLFRELSKADPEYFHAGHLRSFEPGCEVCVRKKNASKVADLVQKTIKDFFESVSSKERKDEP